MAEQDYANTGYRLDRLVSMGFLVMVSRCDGKVRALCTSHKAVAGYGDTPCEALAQLEVNLARAGFIDG